MATPVSAADNQIDAKGCVLSALRVIGCLSLLIAMKFIAILIAGAVFTLFF